MVVGRAGPIATALVLANSRTVMAAVSAFVAPSARGAARPTRESVVLIMSPVSLRMAPGAGQTP